MRYESPFVEIIKFNLKTSILAASNSKTENIVEQPSNGEGIGGGDEEDLLALD